MVRPWVGEYGESGMAVSAAVSLAASMAGGWAGG